VKQAALADVQLRMLRPLTTAENNWVPTALADALRFVEMSLPDVAVQLARLDLADDAPYRYLVVQVQCAMVIRVLQNPDGVLEETTDDYTRRLDSARSTGALYMSAEERAILSAGTGGTEGAFSIRARPATQYPIYFPTSTTDTWQ
jgi:hypothetical protein